jgi:hypothetical protein
VQQEFHDAVADEVLFGGGAGPGKTEALLWDPFPIIDQEHRRWREEKRTFRSTARILHVQRTFPQLEEAIDRTSMILRHITGQDKIRYDGDSHIFQLSCGLTYQFGHMKDSTSWQNYYGKQYVALYFDELIQFEEQQYKQLTTRVRSSDPLLRPFLRVRAASNPGPGWVRDHFVEPAPNGRKLLSTRFTMSDGTVSKKTRMFIPARLSDHPDAEFRREYERNLRGNPPHIIDALLNGNWYVAPGAYYARCWDPNVHVCKPFAIPDSWPRFRACDWGFKSACVVLWFAIAPNEQLICYREETYKGLDWTQVAESVKKVELRDGIWSRLRNRSMICGPLDTQAWEERGHTGPTIALGMMKHGVPWIKATKGRKQAAQELVRRLNHRNKDGSPGIVFFDTCKELIKTVPTLPTDPSDPEVPQKGGPDHWYDALTYGVMARYTYQTLLPPLDEDED